MKNKQIFLSCWSFLAEQKYDFVSLHNSKLHRRTNCKTVASIDRDCKIVKLESIENRFVDPLLMNCKNDNEKLISSRVPEGCFCG